jgi:hypothetical protein
MVIHSVIFLTPIYIRRAPCDRESGAIRAGLRSACLGESATERRMLPDLDAALYCRHMIIDIGHHRRCDEHDVHKSPARRPRLALVPFVLCPVTRTAARRQSGDGREILPVMSYLPGTIAALHIVNSLVSVIPFGEKVGVGVEAAITLCETIQVRRK